ncbi:hypothetical protein EJB05_25410, partial [Eragrostis curvula]
MDSNLEFFQMMMFAKAEEQGAFFMEIFIIAAWQIWKQRNSKIFHNEQPSTESWLQNFFNEATLQAHRMSIEKKESFTNKIDFFFPTDIQSRAAAYYYNDDAITNTLVSYNAVDGFRRGHAAASSPSTHLTTGGLASSSPRVHPAADAVTGQGSIPVNGVHDSIPVNGVHDSSRRSRVREDTTSVAWRTAGISVRRSVGAYVTIPGCAAA